MQSKVESRKSKVDAAAQNAEQRPKFSNIGRRSTFDLRLSTFFFTWRAGALFGAIAALWLLTGWSSLFRWVAIAANLAGVLVIALDLERTAGPSSLSVERLHDTQLSLGAENTITLRVRSLSSVEMRIQLRGGPPLEMEPNPPVFSLTLPPQEQREITYTLTPTERGEYAFRDVWARREGRLGFIVRQWVVPMERRVKVYPNVRATRKYETLLVRGRLHELGLRSARSLGAGREFASLREYQPDDEFRAIDWNATARRTKLIVRQYEVERSQQVVTVLDCGRLMSAPVLGARDWGLGTGEKTASRDADPQSSFLLRSSNVSPQGSRASQSLAPSPQSPVPSPQPPVRMTKLDFAINAALVFSYVALAMGDKAGLLTFAEEAGDYLPPNRGSGQLNRILDELYSVQATAMNSSFRDAYLQLQSRLRKRSLLLFFTDLTDPDTAKSAVKYLGLLSRRHLCVCVAIGDPEVAEWAAKTPKDESEIYRQVIALTTLQDRALALSELRRAGVQVVDTLPEALTAEAVNRYLELKTAGRL